MSGPSQDLPAPTVPVSVVATLYNEGDSIGPLLDSMLSGSRLPAEIVITDGGSDDGTDRTVAAYAAEDPRIRLIRRRAGRSEGRNIAIEAARHEAIVTIDGGCVADHHWLERISDPLLNGEVWVAGFYEPRGGTARSTAIGLTMVFVREEVTEDGFLPSARSMGFRREAWRAVGGFPERVQFAEDTAFGEALRAAGHRPRLALDAVVGWRPPPGFIAQARTLYNWGRGDGLLGLRSYHYRYLLVRFLAAGLLLGLGVALPPLAVLTPLPLLPALWVMTRHKFGHMAGWAKWVLIPLATLNGAVSSLAGFCRGYLERRSRDHTPSG